MACTVGKRFQRPELSSLRQRIRPVGLALAKMEIRAPVLINADADDASGTLLSAFLRASASDRREALAS
jgi:hypothetical protein